ncbi:MAG: hypothetical protein HRT44_12995, partial [Bdellovibrionales bacterium]|nr:hypothetical protein [Bdellovibrionales bacterium]NQZ20154.1 hypothetical protein [Bdellovibrionales bacterium]
KETGLNRYERIKNFDFSEGQKYWEATKGYWSSVRKEWSNVIAKNKVIKVKTDNYGKKMYQSHFDFAQQIVDKNQTKKSDIDQHAKTTINSFLKK